MPLPGRPRNPEAELPLRFHETPHLSIEFPGETPGLMDVSTRRCVLAAGQVRRLWRQAIDFIPAPPPYSWSANGVSASPQFAGSWTRALRYLAGSYYERQNSDNTRWGAPRPAVRPKYRFPTPTIAAGVKQSRPTIRNRLSSFGSRVQPLISRVPAAQDTGSP